MQVNTQTCTHTSRYICIYLGIWIASMNFFPPPIKEKVILTLTQVTRLEKKKKKLYWDKKYIALSCHHHLLLPFLLVLILPNFLSFLLFSPQLLTILSTIIWLVEIIRVSLFIKPKIVLIREVMSLMVLPNSTKP